MATPVNKDEEITLGLPICTTIATFLLLGFVPFMGWVPTLLFMALTGYFSAVSFWWRIKARRLIRQKQNSL